MNRRKVCSLSVAFLLGIAAVEYRLPSLWWIAAVYGLAFAFSLWKEYAGVWRKEAVWILAFLAAISLGGYDSYRAMEFRSRYEPLLKDEEECLIQGEIYKRETQDEEQLFYLRDCKMQLYQKEYFCNQIILHLKSEEHFIGEILCVKGKIRTFARAANEGNYDERAYYQSLKIDFRVMGEDVLLVRGKKNRFFELLFSMKEKMRESYERAMPEADAGVLVAMTTGDKSRMDDGRKKLYQDAGISHFYSISGLHISLLGMALFHFLRKMRGSYFAAGAIAAFALFSYGGMIGFGISASRAIGMFFLLLYAKFRGRSYDRMTALALLAAVFAGQNPKLLHHAGFLLSFGAVLGVIFAEWVLAQMHLKEAKTRLKKWARSLWETFFVSFSIQLLTIPILCVFFYELPLYATFVNLVVLPCMGALLGMGMLGGVMGCFFPFAGKLVLYPCHLLLALFDAVCAFFTELPCASLITGTLVVFEIFLWYGSLLLFLLLRTQKKKISVFFFLLPFCILLPWQGQGAFEMDVLDVGQGDGIFLSMEDGTSVFLDGGSSSVTNVGTYRILPFLKFKGIRRVEYWFVSHCDEDHVSGLREVIESGYPIGCLLVSKYMPRDEAWLDLEALAKDNGILIREMDKGDAVKGEDGAWSIKCLSFAAQSGTSDRNENSLALLLERENLTAFFAGDIAAAQEENLAREWELPRVDVYKASHHGSRFSNGEELLAELKPRLAVISCAGKNSYGHPGEETLQRLEEAGSEIYETRFLGQIKITANLEAQGFCMVE